MDNPVIFDLIERLVESLPLESAKVGDTLRTRLVHDPKSDTPVLTSYAQAADVADSPYESVELRIPHPVFGSGGGLLNVALKSDCGIDTEKIFEKYGLDFQTEVPSPRYPAGLPTFYSYEQPWGRLSFGVFGVTDEADKLVSFILKPKKPA